MIERPRFGDYQDKKLYRRDYMRWYNSTEKGREYNQQHARVWGAKNKERKAAWNKANPYKKTAESASLIRAKRLKRNVAWGDEFSNFVIREMYHLAQHRTAATGFAWEVDHILPLQGSNVSGLHVHNNLQVIPGHVNRAKHNRGY